jgi:L,D-peptidoglycan transpeptidase YkuD (ErfK/YbiS/YcfS/YnhG family)
MVGWGAAAVVVLTAAGGTVQAATGHHIPGLGALDELSAGGGSGGSGGAAAAAPVLPDGRSASAHQAAMDGGPRPTVTGYASIPGVGAAFAKRIPSDSRQVVLMSGAGRNKNTGTLTLWTRNAQGRWTAGPSWPARNALRGWTTDHHLDDLRSPIGVYSLTDAGGLKANPGTSLPYDHSSSFVAVGRGFEGESLAGAFDYVVAIDYNHVAGSSPLDARRPMGEDRGGGIWLHVDHGGPTHGCVALPEPDIKRLLTELDPAAHPVIVMGDASTLAA